MGKLKEIKGLRGDILHCMSHKKSRRLTQRSHKRAISGWKLSNESFDSVRPSEPQVISTTLFKEEDYKAAWEAPMARIIDYRGLRYPGIRKVGHVYFYRVPVADDETRRDYLKRAYKLGKEFAQS